MEPPQTKRLDHNSGHFCSTMTVIGETTRTVSGEPVGSVTMLRSPRRRGGRAAAAPAAALMAAFCRRRDGAMIAPPMAAAHFCAELLAGIAAAANLLGVHRHACAVRHHKRVELTEGGLRP